jgi:hypothetical protein
MVRNPWKKRSCLMKAPNPRAQIHLKKNLSRMGKKTSQKLIPMRVRSFLQLKVHL